MWSGENKCDKTRATSLFAVIEPPNQNMDQLNLPITNIQVGDDHKVHTIIKRASRRRRHINHRCHMRRIELALHLLLLSICHRFMMSCRKYVHGKNNWTNRLTNSEYVKVLMRKQSVHFSDTITNGIKFVAQFLTRGAI
jgi:hypothetical protein